MIVTGSAAEQGSDSWLAWRRTKITASEIGIILGNSPWTSAFDLWRQKLGFSEGFKGNWATERGHKMEPIIRKKVNEEMGRNFQPAVVQQDELEWCGASLDGLDGDDILEIKCAGAPDHKTAFKGGIPDKYRAQLQWQMFCAGKETCYYASYNNEDLVIIEVARDDDYIANVLLPAAADFKRRVEEFDPPAKEEDDYVEIENPDFEDDVREWRIDSNQAKYYIAREKKGKAKLISYTDDSNCKGAGVKLTRVSRKGSIDYEKLLSDMLEDFPELEKYDPENYRSDQIGYWKVTDEKGEEQ